MEKLKVVAKKLQKSERILSGLLRISHIYENPESFYEKIDTVGGWIKNIKAQKKLIFINLSDGSCARTLQIVVDETFPDFELLHKQKAPACLKITGKFVKSPKEKQPIELVLQDESHKVELLGSNMSPSDYIFASGKPSLETLRSYLHLRPRSNLIPAISRLRNALAMATHQYYQELGFIYVHTPILTANDCEGAGEMFQVTTLIDSEDKISTIPEQQIEDKQKPKDQWEKTGKIDYKKDFFGKKTSLTVSGQLAVENYACALTNVYTFGPTFRAEVSHTTRHLSEFWMIEPEICFAGLDELFVLIEGYIKFCIDYCFQNIQDDMDYFQDVYKMGLKQKKKEKKSVDGFDDLQAYLKKILETPFQRMSYTDAIDFLMKEVEQKKVKFENKVEWGIDLNSEHERYICEKHIKGPVFIYNYPKEIKAFYMKRNEDQKTVQGTDLLLPFIGELVGGSVREERLDVLEKSIDECGLNKEDYSFYLDLRRYGTVPHAGFGLGFERMVMLMSGIENIREAIPFPRYPGKCDC